jgi:glycosyltransferase involved in cell wall biosynthesis
MKVLHVIPSVSPLEGGPSRAIVDIERALTVRGIEVTTVTTSEPGAQMESGVPIKVAGVTRWYFPRNSSFYKISFSLASWLKRNIQAFDVVHAHALFSFVPIVAAFFARSAGVPYVLRPLGVLNHYGMTQRHPSLKWISLALIERPLIENAAAVHFTSLAEEVEAEKLHLRCRGVVIPLGVDRCAAVWPSGEAPNNNPDQPRLLFLSRIDPKKNLEGLLLAFARLRARSPTLILDIVGTGEENYVNALKSLAAELAISERIRWHGYLGGEAKDRVMAGASAFVLPSLSENFGIAVVEALAAGLPCIVSHEVAVSGKIKAAGAGVVVGTDPDSIALGVDQFLGNRERHAALRSAALHLAATEFSLSAMGERLEALYNNIAFELAHGRRILAEMATK